MLREKLRLTPKKPMPEKLQELRLQRQAFDTYSDSNYEMYDTITRDPLIDQIPDAEKKEAIGEAFELYLAAKTNVAPVIVGFADELLSTAEGRQIIFAARDGLGAYEAAKVLLERFSEQYDTTPDDLVFAYLTRKVVQATDHDTLAEYLEQTGVRNTEDPLIVADIGMYGTFMYDVGRVLPQAEARYLISRNSSIPGYADDGGAHRMDSFSSIVGNPAVHFMEDTFSGSTSSPSRLEERDGMLVPNFVEDAFEPKELLKRKYAIQAIIDCAATIDHTPTDIERRESIDTLDAFLVDRNNYAHLMVPHIR